MPECDRDNFAPRLPRSHLTLMSAMTCSFHTEQSVLYVAQM